MSWRLAVRHTTRYRYTEPVTSSYDEARLTPVTDLAQTVLEASVLVDPPPLSTQRYWDHWGTQVTAFDLHAPHEHLVVTGRSVVETDEGADPVPTGWADLEALEDDLHELLQPTPRTAPAPEALEQARQAVDGLEPLDAARAVLALARERVAYRSGTTGVQTSAADAWRQGEGVCQDVAHVALGLLRAVGLPARYVSGYLHPSGPSAEVGRTVAGESHAWVEVRLGDWWPFDPTGGVPVGPQHVVVARGRDYGDVVPVKGVYAGGGEQSLEVRVEVTRLA